MRLERLALRDYRNWPELELVLEAGVTVFLGRNGQGKTNLVEAVCYPSALGSHRVSQTTALIRQGAEQAVVRLQVAHEQRRLQVDLELNLRGANRAQLAGRPAKLRELPAAVRTVLFAPEDLALVRGAPAGRREFLDQALAQRSPRLAEVLADYERVVRQRNTLLRSARGVRAPELATLELWDDKLVELGAVLIRERWRFLVELRPQLDRAYAAIAAAGHAPGIGMAISALGAEPQGEDGQDPLPGAGSPEAVAGEGGAAARLPDAVPEADQLQAAFRERLGELRPRELERGITLAGPHRDDVLWWLRGLPVRGYASHGESWSFALALKLALAELLRAESRSGDPILVLDDVFAELDAGRRERLGVAIAGFEQVLITAAVAEDLPALAEARIVRVEAGTVVP